MITNKTEAELQDLAASFIGVEALRGVGVRIQCYARYETEGMCSPDERVFTIGYQYKHMDSGFSFHVWNSEPKKLEFIWATVQNEIREMILCGEMVLPQ